jgi:hypothetical protein
MKHNGTPRVITLDAYAASHRAVRELKADGKMPKRVRVRSSKFLNNGVEQDHRRVKQRIRPMLGFKCFDTAAVTISGIELAAKIRKYQFKVGKLPGRPKTLLAIWAVVVRALINNRRSFDATRASIHLHQNLPNEREQRGEDLQHPKIVLTLTRSSAALIPFLRSTTLLLIAGGFSKLKLPMAFATVDSTNPKGKQVLRYRHQRSEILIGSMRALHATRIPAPVFSRLNLRPAPSAWVTRRLGLCEEE